MNHLKFFSSCLKDLLSENDMSIKKLSEFTGIKLSRLYDFINGLHIPSLSNAIKITETFQCPLDFIFGFCSDYQPCNYITKDTVANRVKLAIDSSKYSRYQISKISKISQQQLLRWYHGKQMPTLVSLIILSENLNCSLDYLAGRD